MSIRQQIMGLDVIKDINTGLKTYREIQLLARTFEERMYFLPIATYEINKNEGSIVQNTGW